MFLNILKKDIKRKKTMNVILLLFIIMASMFLSSSASNLKTVLGAVDEFLKISKVPDFFVLAINGSNEDNIKDYMEKSQYIKEYGITQMFNLSNENIAIKKCKNRPDNKRYSKTNTLAVSAISEDFMKVFNQDGTAVKLEEGEIAIHRVEAEANYLSVGDVLEIQVQDITRTFTIKTIVKDAVFGTSMMGFKRFYISEEDFKAFEAQDNLYYTTVYSVNTDNMKDFENEFREQNFKVIISVEKKLVKMCYVFDMLISCILIIVSICLILIAFLILRFTIIFTLQEDYKEIGIMKAIGIRDRDIRGIYLVKYLVIAVTGALMGLIFSFPFGQFLMKQVIANIVIVQKNDERIINIVCAACIVGIVMAFCYMSTGRLNRFTAMEAIRSGSGGERFHKKSFLKLKDCKHMKVSFYMACNDILSNKKRFFVLGFIFCIGMLLILLPLSAINTLNSSDIIKSFSMLPSTAYIDNGKTDIYMVKPDISTLESDMAEIEKTMKKHGMESRVWAEVGYTIPCYSHNPKEIYNYFTLQGTGHGNGSYQVIDGRLPELENEIMLTELMAEEMEVGIGDSIFYKLPDETKEYVITGIYQTMVNMGKAFRMNPLEKIDYRYISGVLSMQVDVPGDMNQDKALKEIKNIFPDYDVQDVHEFINDMTGGVQTQLDALQLLIVGLVLVINCLITVLMMKTLIAREHGEIAMLKSIGFPNIFIWSWQTYRIVIVLFGAILAGILLSSVLAGIAVKPIFSMMGATSMELIINPLESYILYPLVLLFITGLSAMLCAGEIRKVDLKEMNDLE